jgi:hypothetical protein
MFSYAKKVEQKSTITYLGKEIQSWIVAYQSTVNEATRSSNNKNYRLFLYLTLLSSLKQEKVILVPV